MKLFNMNNKLVQLKHKITKEQFIKMNLPKDQFESLIQMELYKQMTDHIMKNMKIQVITNEEDTEFKGRAYFMSERDMFNVLLEITELDSDQMERLNNSLKKELGIFS